VNPNREEALFRLTLKKPDRGETCRVSGRDVRRLRSVEPAAGLSLAAHEKPEPLLPPGPKQSGLRRSQSWRRRSESDQFDRDYGPKMPDFIKEFK
jgi:hypothetical protein